MSILRPVSDFDVSPVGIFWKMIPLHVGAYKM